MLNQQLALAINKYKQLEQPQIDLRFIPSAFQDVFIALTDANFIDYDRIDQRIYLRSENSHRYLSGAWLEEYFYLVAKRAGLIDVHSGIEITDNFDTKKNIRNELDGVATQGNRVLLVECKTSSFGKDQTKDSSIVYKLDSIAHQVGGIFFTTLLLSAQQLDHTTSSNRDVYTTARANAADIRVVAGKDLLKLEAALKYWVSHRRWPSDLHHL
jgi:Holliday junction resolvase